MRVALCFFGQPRVIENPFTYQSHIDHIISKYDVDVYAHAWISGGERSLEYSDWVKDDARSTEHPNAAQIILDRYKPKKYLFEEPKTFSLDEASRDIVKACGPCPAGAFYWSPNNENNTMSQLYSVSKTIQLLDGESYDWVILSRYDNFIDYFPNLNELQPNLYLSNRYEHFVDVLMFGSQPHISTLNCFDNIPELCRKINYFTPEEFKRTAFQTHYQSEGRVPIGVGIARSNSLDKIQK
jgi:hypothetical protein